MNALILHSQDGQEHAHVILYPTDWTPEQADTLALAAFSAAQQSNPDEWSWEDYEPELEKRGFVIPCWHHGPVWDETVDPRFPTLYAMQRIGVNAANEAIEAFHFCSPACRAKFKADNAPFTDGGWTEGDETLSVDESVCEQCSAKLEGRS